jgi:CHAD domain-containing protein
MDQEKAGHLAAWRDRLDEYDRKFMESAGAAVIARDEESVHQARVNMRKLMALLKLLDADDREGFRDALQHAMKPLGKLRDRDVLIAQFKRRRKAEEDKDTRKMLKRFIRLQKTQRESVQKKLEKKLYPVFRKQYRKSWREFLGKKLEEYAVITDVSAVFRKREREYKAGFKRYEEHRKTFGSSDPATLSKLHEVRLLVKELRYILKCADFALDQRYAKKAEFYESLQERLGDVNDCRTWLKYWNRSSAEELGAPEELYRKMTDGLNREMEDFLGKV